MNEKEINERTNDTNKRVSEPTKRARCNGVKRGVKEKGRGGTSKWGNIKYNNCYMFMFV